MLHSRLKNIADMMYLQQCQPPHGHADAVHGMVLGHQAAQLERLIYIAEMHGRTLDILKDVLVATGNAVVRLETAVARLPPPLPCPHPTPPTATPPKEAEKMTWRDKLQLAVFLAAILGAVLGKLPWDKVTAFGKPFGL